MTKIFPMQCADVRQRIVKRRMASLEAEITRQRDVAEISRARPAASSKPRDKAAARAAKARRDEAERTRKAEEALAGIKAIYQDGARIWFDLIEETTPDTTGEILFSNIEALFDDERRGVIYKSLRGVVSSNAPERLAEIDDIEVRWAFSIRAAAKAALRKLSPEKRARSIAKACEDERVQRREDEDQEIRARLFDLYRRANKNRDGADKPLFSNFAAFAQGER